MASLAELYLPFVAVVQFVLAAIILWFGRASTRACLAATILVANGLQGIAIMGYSLAQFVGRPALNDGIVRATGLEAVFWSSMTEYVIAAAVGMLAWSFVRPLRRGPTLAVLFGVFLGIPYLASILVQGPANYRYGAMSSGSDFVFATALVVTGTIALPHVLRMKGTSERAHGMLVLAAVLIPMAQQHFWYTLSFLDMSPADRFDTWWTAVTVGAVSAVVLTLAVVRLLAAWRRDHYRAALWLAVAILASMTFTFLRRDVFADFIGEWIPSSTQVFAQLVRPSLLLLAFARFEFVRLPRKALRPLTYSMAGLIGLSVFAVVQFMTHGRAYDTYTLDPVPAFIGLVAGALVAVLAVPRLVAAVDDAALEDEAGGRGLRLERYKAALMAGDPGAPRLREELGITRKEHEAMQHVLEGNLVIPEVAARGLRPGDRIEGYTILAPLGEGGQGIVVRGEDHHGRQVVIKQVRDAWAATARDRIRALKREAAAGTGLREVIENPFACYLVRDYVPGTTLDQADGIDVERLRTDITAQLSAMHARGWVHGDIKPGNIIITPDGAAVLIDEGAARAVDETQTISFGSLAYAAPEQKRGQVGPASDIYQLGKVLEPLAGPGLAEWVRAALDPDPLQRPALA